MKARYLVKVESIETEKTVYSIKVRIQTPEVNHPATANEPEIRDVPIDAKDKNSALAAAQIIIDKIIAEDKLDKEKDKVKRKVTADIISTTIIGTVE